MKSSNQQYAELCLLELNANQLFNEGIAKWKATNGIATRGQIDMIERLVFDLKMEEMEHQYYMVKCLNLAFDDAQDVIRQLKDRLNPEPIYIPERKVRHEISMVLADQDYKVIEQKERRLWILDSENKYCHVKGIHPEFYSPDQLQKRTFEVEITKTLKGDPVWIGRATLV
jgi:hypothetical protein